MCAGSVEHKHIPVIAVDQQPVRRNKALPISFMITCQLVISVPIRQWGRNPECIDHCLKLPQIIPALCTGLEFFLNREEYFTSNMINPPPALQTDLQLIRKTDARRLPQSL